MKFKAVIFDMDGTLTVPLLDFGLIRREAGLPPAGDIVSVLNAMPDEKRHKACFCQSRKDVVRGIRGLFRKPFQRNSRIALTKTTL